MKFIVDAQLPKKLKTFLVSNGFDTIHTLEIPLKNLTPDSEIIKICNIENRVVITKDSDFYDSKIIRKIPQKIVFVQTGNIINTQLLHIFETNIKNIVELLEQYDIVIVDRDILRAT